MASVITTVSSPSEDQAAWKAAAKVAGLPLSIWVRHALNAAAEAVQDEAAIGDQFQPRPPMRGAGAPVEPPEPEPTYKPPKLKKLPRGATTAPEPVDMERMRQRGWVAGFIRSGGDVRMWKGVGPHPLLPGCTVRKDVLAEFAPQLEQLRGAVEHDRAMRNLMAAQGVPV